MAAEGVRQDLLVVPLRTPARRAPEVQVRLAVDVAGACRPSPAAVRAGADGAAPPPDFDCLALCRRPGGSWVGGVVSPDGAPPKRGRPVGRARWRDLRVGDRVLIRSDQDGGEALAVTEIAG